MTYDAKQISRMLADKAEVVVTHLLPNGKRQGAEWCVGSVGGEKGDSLRVHLRSDKAGIWSDFADGQKGGDLLDLYCAVKGENLVGALRWAKDYLGIVEPSFYRAPEVAPKTYSKPKPPQGVRRPQSSALDYLTVQRGLKAETLAAFQVAEIESYIFRQADITCPAVVFPFKADGELKLLKYLGTERTNDGKKLIAASADSEPVLFGWQAFNPSFEPRRSVIIAEGEINAMSWHQYGFNALATPFGAGGGHKHDWIDREWERLAQFESIYLSFDQDQAGRAAVTELSQRLGRHRCFVIPPMPAGHKDVNDCLFAGVDAQAVRVLVEQSATSDPEELRAAVDFTDAVIEEFYPTTEHTHGIPTPFDCLRGKFNFRHGELTIVTGYTGHGKTQLLNWLHLNLMAVGERVCIASFEMRASKLLKRAVRQMTAQRDPSTEYIRQVMAWTRDRFWLFDKVGQANRARVLEVFEYAMRRYGVRFFVVDSLMKLDISEDDYPRQSEFANTLANFANEHNVHITLVAHPRKDDDDEKPAGIQGVKGSNGLINQAHNLLSVWRNKPREAALQRAMAGEDPERGDEKLINKAAALVLIDKQREGDGWQGRVGLAFDEDSQQFLDPGQVARPLVPFVCDGAQVRAYEDEYVPEF